MNRNIAFKMYSECDDVLVDGLYYSKFDETFEVKVLAQLLSKSRVFLDIGANTGLYSLFAIALNPNIEVHSFEPYQANFDRLKQNIKINKFNNIQVNPDALGSSIGQIPFYIPLGARRISQVSSVNKHFTESHWQNDIKDYEMISVDQTTLDKYVEIKSLTHIDLIKIDVESNEYNVLVGSQETLLKYRPIILCEISNEYLKIQELLTNLSYQIFSISEGGLQATTNSIRGGHRNYFLIPIDKLSTITSLNSSIG